MKMEKLLFYQRSLHKEKKQKEFEVWKQKVLQTNNSEKNISNKKRKRQSKLDEFTQQNNKKKKNGKRLRIKKEGL